MNEVSSDNGNANGTRARSRSFRSWQPNVTLSPDQARRQSAVLRSAHHNLASRDATVAFLNSYNQKLGGVPLHLALESDAGLFRVEQLFMRTSAKREAVVRLGAPQ